MFFPLTNSGGGSVHSPGPTSDPVGLALHFRKRAGSQEGNLGSCEGSCQSAPHINLGWSWETRPWACPGAGREELNRGQRKSLGFPSTGGRRGEETWAGLRPLQPEGKWEEASRQACAAHSTHVYTHPHTLISTHPHDTCTNAAARTHAHVHAHGEREAKGRGLGDQMKRPRGQLVLQSVLLWKEGPFSCPPTAGPQPPQRVWGCHLRVPWPLHLASCPSCSATSPMVSFWAPISHLV